MKLRWHDWWDGIWLYFCVCVCSLPIVLPVLFVFKFGEAGDARGVALLVAVLYVLIVGPVLFSRGIRSLDGQRPEPETEPASDQPAEETYEMRCPECGAPVNPITRAGLHSPEREPWRLICDRCQATIQPHV